MAEQDNRGFLGGLLLGAAVGTFVGLLLAPRNGKETRRLLQNSLDGLPNATQDRVDGFQVKATSFLDQTRAQVDETLTRLQEAITAGKKATQEYQNNPPATSQEPEAAPTPDPIP